MAVGIGVLAVLVVAGLLLLGGDVPLIPDAEDEGPTEFSFELKRVKASPVSDREPEELQAEADEAATAVQATMDQLYFGAYVDRDAWGDYGDAFALFEEPVSEQAESDAEVLTLGETAPQDYERLGSAEGRLSIEVLTDERDVPVSAIATVIFRADTQLKGGGSTKITSTGSFFLRPVEDGWLIFAYRVDRDERATGSPSPTEASP